jgi:hypothetical protein
MIGLATDPCAERGANQPKNMNTGTNVKKNFNAFLVCIFPPSPKVNSVY